MSEIAIRPVRAEDYEAWDPLYEGYCRFYMVPSDRASRRIVFDWLMDADEVLEGLVVEAGGRVVGLAHFREMPRPLWTQKVGFLDDLFIDPAARGQRIGEHVFAALADIARARGWRVVRWLTQDHNYAARTLYDRIGAKSMVNTYEMTID